jgi:hypothetical protein
MKPIFMVDYSPYSHTIMSIKHNYNYIPDIYGIDMRYSQFNDSDDILLRTIQQNMCKLHHIQIMQSNRYSILTKQEIAEKVLDTGIRPFNMMYMCAGGLLNGSDFTMEDLYGV